MATGIGQRPRSLDEPLYLDVEPQAAAELPGAARVLSHRAAVHDDRPAQLHLFDRRVADVALTHRHARRLAVGAVAAAPATALDALRDEAAAGRRIRPEEHHGAAEDAEMRG